MKKEKVIIGTFIISILFIIALAQVRAVAQEGCCLDTGKYGHKQCVTTSVDKCEGRFVTGAPYDCSNVAECQPGTCIPKDKDQPCLRNKQLSECTALGGIPDSRTLEEIPQCKPGCCIIAQGLKAEVLQFRQCENLTMAIGFNSSEMEFKDSIVSEVECKKQGSPTDLGCCTFCGGDCSYETRQSCGNGSFIPLSGGMYCSDISQCAVKRHAYCSCGTLPGTETDIYWFDSQNNQEGILKAEEKCTNSLEQDGNCDYPEKICTKDTTEKVFCKSTMCSVKGQAQNISSKDSYKVSPIDISTNMLTGTSICYNFYTSYIGKPEDSTKNATDIYLQGRSTGLQNEILHCAFQKIEIESLGTDRQKLCVPANSSVQGGMATFHANAKNNKWQNCSKCGKSTGILGDYGDKVGDFLGPAPIGFPSGSGWASILGAYCTAEKCKDLGDCYYHEDLSALKGPGVIWGNTPEGSCDPIYPPGGTNSQCGDCGEGGDPIWNLCTRAECYSKGDCTFSKAEWYTKWGTYMWYWPGLALGERISMTIPECIITPIHCASVCTSGLCTDIACYDQTNVNVLKCLGDRSKAYVLVGLGWAVGGQLIDLAWNALQSKVTGTITSQIQNGINQAIGGVTGGNTCNPACATGQTCVNGQCQTGTGG